MIFLLIAALFSSSESAYHLLADKLTTKLTQKGRFKLYIVSIIKSPPKFLHVTLTARRFFHAATIVCFCVVGMNLASFFLLNVYWFLAIAFLVASFVTMVFGNTLPKFITEKDPQRFVQRYHFLFFVLVSLISPIFYPTLKLVHYFSDRYGISESSILMYGDKFKPPEERLDDSEKEMIESIIKFGDTTVKEVMVPRTRMICFEARTTLDQVMETIKGHGHSRIPVYEENIDNIKGILYVKDLIPHVRDGSPDLNLIPISRPAHFVPESKMIDELLRDFQKGSIHMAIVVDEYGGTEGLVTLEDVLEEIVGDIRDEHDDREYREFVRIDENTFVVDAVMSVEDFNDESSFELPLNSNYDTVGGLILFIAGKIPAEEDQYRHENFRFVVHKMDGNSLSKIRITKLDRTREVRQDTES